MLENFRPLSEIPAAWRLAIEHVRQTFPDAVIAGGCLRDWLHYKDSLIKDIDIFIPGAEDNDIVDYVSNNHSKDNPACYVNYGNMSNDDVSIVCKIEKTCGDGISCDYIGVKVDSGAILDRFDFGICQIAYDGKSLTCTNEFLTDVTLNTFTLLRCDNADQFRRSRERFDRLHLKYPNHTFRNVDFTQFESPNILLKGTLINAKTDCIRT